MTELVVSKRAEAELLDIWLYIAADNEPAADGVLRRIDRKVQCLREFPDIGRCRDDLRPGARILIEGVYLILYDYRPDDDVVEIVTVVDGRRDLKTLPLFAE